MDITELANLSRTNEPVDEALKRICEKTAASVEMASALYSVGIFAGEIKESFERLSETVAGYVLPVLSNFSENLERVWDPDEVFFMVPSRIKHLAYNHPKARVRNKNWNRMWKIHERYMRCHKN